MPGYVFLDEPQNNYMKWKCVIYAIDKAVKEKTEATVVKETLSEIVKNYFV